MGFILFSSVLALAYFVNVIRYMYFPPDETGESKLEAEPEFHEGPWAMRAPMVALAVAIVLLGVFNGDVVSLFLERAVTDSLGR